MKMREKTKVELTKLAEILISKYRINEIINSNELLEVAKVEARLNKIEVDRQSITIHERFIKDKCEALQGHVDYMASQSKSLQEVYEDLEDDDNFYDCYGDVVDDMAIVRRAVEIMSRFGNGSKPDTFFDTLGEVGQRFPDYSMFVEGEDGLMVIKGSYKGKTLDEIDEVNFKGAKRGWAKWCLDNDKNLTDDDRDVFTRILVNQL